MAATCTLMTRGYWQSKLLWISGRNIDFLPVNDDLHSFIF
jgi:hypothetical protein